jgi:broad specificity phosphatase PhoE
MNRHTEPFRIWDTRICSWTEIASATASSRAPEPIELTLVRHGQTTNNAKRLITGASDPPLTSVGLEQAIGLRDVLDPAYDVAFHSNFRRTRETLKLALAGHQVGAVLDDPRIAERSMGALEGEPTRPLPAYDLGDLFWAPTDGENYGAVTRRATSFLLDLVAAGRRAGRALRVLAASHVGTIRILSSILDRLRDPVAVLTRQFANAVPLRFDFRTVGWPPFVDRLEIGL